MSVAFNSKKVFFTASQMEEPNLRYADERDKTYGIAGMAISLVACDGGHLLAEIKIDADPGECMVMANSFGLKGNPRMSAKIVWEQTVQELRATTSMVLGNIACRRYILDHMTMTPADTHHVMLAVREEAREHCALDTDEADALFGNCLSYVDRVFRHSGVQEIARRFADRLAAQRTMSADEAIELLAQLGMR